MSVIGVPLCGPDDLYLTKGRDFAWTFQYSTETGEVVDFPAGKLYFEFDLDPVVCWDFSISGSVASIKVESENVDEIPNYTRWQLVFLPDGELAGGSAVARGVVRVQR